MIITRRKALFIPLAPAIIGLARPSAAQLMTTGAGGKPGGAPPAGETWNPAKVSADVILTSGNLIAGNDALALDGYWAPVLSLTGRSTGKYTFEAQINALHDAYDFMTGLTADPGAGNYKYYPTQASSGVAADGANNFYRSATTAGVSQYMGAAAVNDYWHWDVDFGAGKIWCFVVTSGHTTYDNGGNPATGANPSTTFTPGLVLYATGCVGGTLGTSNANKLKLLTGASILGPIPSGFTSW